MVTIEAWHDDFGKPRVNLHADVVFGTARLGGEAESPVRFRLRVKRAEVIVIVPDSEPVSIDRLSVSRDSPELHGRLKEAFAKKSQGGVKGGLSASLSKLGFSGKASAEAQAEATVSASKEFEMSGDVPLISVTQSKTADGHYRWSLEPHNSRALEGRPWDAMQQPRLALQDNRKDRSSGIPPTVRVEVHCKREDLEIEDLVIKDESQWKAVKRGLGSGNKMAAAESYIRDRLMSEGLDVVNIEDVFGQITLGSVIAESISGK